MEKISFARLSSSACIYVTISEKETIFKLCSSGHDTEDRQLAKIGVVVINVQMPCLVGLLLIAYLCHACDVDSGYDSSAAADIVESLEEAQQPANTEVASTTPTGDSNCLNWVSAGASSLSTLASRNIDLAGSSVAGAWLSEWRDASDAAKLRVKIDPKLTSFVDQTSEVIIAGESKPFVSDAGESHDWYGRVMLSILDAKRWIMAIRSGVNHIDWEGGDAIHILTSNDEGRTWSSLNKWFDGTNILGMPLDDGLTHSEPGLYRMPNGDLVLQTWKRAFHEGTLQLRSTDDGKTWNVDIERISIELLPKGVAPDRAIGTQDWFIDPENPGDVYMAFEYFHYNNQAGTLLAKTSDNGHSYQFISWIAPLSSEKDPSKPAGFEPALEYLGDRRILAILRDGAGNRRTWQTLSTDMGLSFSPMQDIGKQIDGGIPGALWQRVRIYRESNPIFQFGASLSEYRSGNGRIWGFGIHSNGGGYTRKPAVYHSDDDGQLWKGPKLLHGAITPGTDTGYGDIKRRTDGSFVASTYYANQDSSIADLEQYTYKFVADTAARIRIEHEDSPGEWRYLYEANTEVRLDAEAKRWRVRLELFRAPDTQSPRIFSVCLSD